MSIVAEPGSVPLSLPQLTADLAVLHALTSTLAKSCQSLPNEAILCDFYRLKLVGRRSSVTGLSARRRPAFHLLLGRPETSLPAYRRGHPATRSVLEELPS